MSTTIKKREGPSVVTTGQVEPLVELFPEMKTESTAAADPPAASPASSSKPRAKRTKRAVAPPAEPAVVEPVHDNEEAFLTSLRIRQDFTVDAVGVRKPLLVVPVRRPSKSDFVRVHPVHALDCFSIELKNEGETFFVMPDVAPILSEFIEPLRLHLAVTRQGVAFLWPTKLPRDDRDRRGELWRRSALDIVDLARTTWVRTVADMGLGAYTAYAAIANLGDPAWPVESWPAIVKVALRDRVIDREDHPVVRQLLGRE